MKLDLKSLPLVLLVLLLVSVSSAAQTPSSIPLSPQATPLLGDRLRIRLPEGFELEPREVSVMAAQKPQEFESRAVFVQGERRLMLVAYELFQTAGPDFQDVLQRTEREVGASSLVECELIKDQDSLKVYLSSGPAEEVDDNAVLVSSAWTVSPDGTVQYLAGYANPLAVAGVADVDEVRKLFSSVLQTLEPGLTTLEAGPRVQSLALDSERASASVRLPEGWVHTLQPGPDFFVHRLRKLSPYATPSVTISLYVGDHPAYFFEQSGSEAESGRGRVLGQRAEWFQSADDDRLLREAIRPARELDDHTMFHLILTGPTEEALEEAQAIADTLKLVEP